ncbi:MAG: alpha/beta hydrolase family protein [Solirubrobacteraceae bacterium]|jgi:fermentation-respiration switch protein FrsA (DUF1100 family)
MVADYLIYSREWGFSAAEVRTEVQLWHGLEDRLVPIEHALALAATLPRCRLFLDPDEGHHFFRSSLARILAVLVGRGGEHRAAVETTVDSALALVQRSGSPLGLGPGPLGGRA